MARATGSRRIEAEEQALRRILSSTVARLVVAIFVLQIACGGIAMVLLHAQMEQVIAADRMRQIFDVRDDLVAAFYDGGQAGLNRYVAEQRGSVGDPLVFVAVAPSQGGGAPLLIRFGIPQKP